MFVNFPRFQALSIDPIISTINEYGTIRYKNTADVMALNAGMFKMISLLNQIVVLIFTRTKRKRDWRDLIPLITAIYSEGTIPEN